MLKRVIVFFTLVALFPQSIQNYAYALPAGGEVQEGSASFESPDPLTLNIVTSHQSIIQWQSFNIAQNESVNFIQPLSSSTALNRVIGGSASEIAGILNANGIIFLVNPAGITFTETASVNVGSLIASSLNITNENFLAGRYVFENDSELQAGQIINMGDITVRGGGLVALFGGTVENSGSIVAELGNIALAAGNKITLSFDSKGYLLVDVTEGIGPELLADPAQPYPSAVRNTGELKASGGKVILTAEQVSNVFERLVNQEGKIEANSVVEREGRILLQGDSGLVRNAGELHADGTSDNPFGGLIEIAGEKIIQRGFVSANALSFGTAGIVNVVSQVATLLTDLSRIEAKGVEGVSRGGTIYVNSLSGNTEFRTWSALDVSGGPQGGDAGFVEVSALEALTFSGKAYGVAQPGFSGGMILLDPRNITITNAGANAVAGGDSAPGTPDETFVEDGAGTNVTYDPRAGGAFNGFNEIFLQASRDIIINSPLDVPTAVGAGGGPNFSLRLEANRNINVNANVSTTTGDLTFTADADNAAGGSFTQAAGVSIISGTGNISITGNGVTLETVTTGGAGNISVTATGGGDILRASAAELLTGNLITLSANTAGGNVGTAAAPINVSATSIDASAQATGIFITESDGALLNNITTSNDPVTITSTTGDLTIGSVNAGTGNVTLEATAGDINDDVDDATVDITGATLTLTANDLDKGIGITNGSLDTDATTLVLDVDLGGINIHDVGSVLLDTLNISSDGSVTLRADGVLTLPATPIILTGAGSMDFSSGGGNLSTAESLETDAGSLTLSASGILTVQHDLTTAGAVINLTADSDGVGGESLNWTAGTISSGGGNVSMTAGDADTGTGNVNLRTLDAWIGEITVISREGSIVEAASGASALTGTTITLTAGAGAGNRVGTLADAINTQSETLNADSGSGGIFIDEADDVTLSNFNAIDGNIVVNLTLGDLFVQTIQAGTGNVTLNAADGSVLDDGSSITGAALTLIAGGADAFVGEAGAPINTEVTSISVTATGAGEIEILELDGATLTNIVIDGGTVTITSQTGDLSVTTVNAGAGDVTLEAQDGRIIDAGSSITGNTLFLTASGADGDIGQAGAALNTTAISIEATATGTGEVVMTESDGATLTNITTADGQATIVSTTGDLSVTTVNAGAGDVTLEAQDGDILDAGSAITGNTLTLTAGGADGDVGETGAVLNTTATSITATATGTGEVVITESDGATLTNITTAGGAITVISNTGDLSINTVNAGAGNVSLTATAGTLSDLAVPISGNVLTLTSATGIGTGVNLLNTTATSLNATVTGAGSINIEETNAVNLVDVTTVGGGNITVTSGGDMTVTLVNAAGAISLTTTGGGSILDGNAGANNLAATADSTLTSAGTIGVLADPLDVNITGATLTVSAGGVNAGVSVTIDGVVTPSNTLNVPVVPAGQVFFNGVAVGAPAAVAESSLGSSVDTLSLFSPIVALNQASKNKQTEFNFNSTLVPGSGFPRTFLSRLNQNLEETQGIKVLSSEKLMRLGLQGSLPNEGEPNPALMVLDLDFMRGQTEAVNLIQEIRAKSPDIPLIIMASRNPWVKVLHRPEGDRVFIKPASANPSYRDIVRSVRKIEEDFREGGTKPEFASSLANGAASSVVLFANGVEEALEIVQKILSSVGQAANESAAASR